MPTSPTEQTFDRPHQPARIRLSEWDADGWTLDTLDADGSPTMADAWHFDSYADALANVTAYADATERPARQAAPLFTTTGKPVPYPGGFAR